MSADIAVLVLAAGKGTRMKSGLIKVLHPLMGQPMLAHVLNAASYLAPSRVVVIVGHQADLVEGTFADLGLTFVHQEQQLGTGHAVASAREALSDFHGTVLILSGDVPLLSPQTMLDFLAAHRESRVPLSVLTVDLPDPGAYGRIVRDEQGYLREIVEARDASAEQRGITEINVGIYAADADMLFEAVTRLTPDNDQQEYYLTDVVKDVRGQGALVAAILCPDYDEVMGINDRVELARATSFLKARINLAWMTAGVTMIDPGSVYIETAVKLSNDVTIWPGVSLLGKTVVGASTIIGPNCVLMDAEIGAGVVLGPGVAAEGVRIPDHSQLGPYTVVGPEKK
jgi:bifunctional UDP-N-acetylglucosamine pyrophosphorylase/glucosamine-1-phosphate N-acetyltransferase